MKVKDFLINTAKGGAIGLAMIIPGVSGGTLAVLLGIYDKMIESVGNLFKQFKKSISFLLPILLGALLAFAALYFPIKYALKYAPFPTITLFAGFMLGSIPDLLFTAKRGGFKKFDVISVIIPLALVIGLCFIPNMGSADLGTEMSAGGYFLLILIGAVASCALVVPGISGSMLLLIFGYYNPILNTISALKDSFGHSLLVLAAFAFGLVVGFFTVAKLMQLLLNKFKRTTFWAIVGFVIGSVPAVIITFFNEYGADADVYLTPLQIALGVIFFIAGAVATYALASLAEKKAKAKAVQSDAQETETPAVAETPSETPTEAEQTDCGQ